MVKDRAIDKVRKLLALAASANEHEAALAASHAHRLLAEHNLSMTDLEVKESGASEDTLDLGTKAADKWMRLLCSIVADAFDCKIIIRSGGGNSARIAFIGCGEDPTVALYTSEFLIAAIRRLSRKFMQTISPTQGKTAAHRKSYRIGAVRGVQQQLREAKIQAPVTSTALVPVKDHLIKSFLAEKYSNARQQRQRKSSVLAEAYAKGRFDGKNLQISKGVGSSHQTAAIRA